MKPPDPPAPSETLRAVAANGAYRAKKKNGVARKPPLETDARADPPAPDMLASPLPLCGPVPIDSPMWPVHSAVWFQPDGLPSPPLWSGLSVERLHRTPMPGFQSSEPMLILGPASPESVCEARKPAAAPVLPPSGLEPLGWDPRAVCRKEGCQ